MDNVSFTIEEENLICIYHKHDHRRTIAAISTRCRIWTQICARWQSRRSISCTT